MRRKVVFCVLVLAALMPLPPPLTPWAGLPDEDRPLVDRPSDDQSVAVGAVAEGVGLVVAAFDVVMLNCHCMQKGVLR